ncbi:MAG: Shedu immune nuclease family protein [Candidatus Thiodiazotropha sp.]
MAQEYKKALQMARIFPRNISQRPEGTLEIEEIHEGHIGVYFIPHEEVLAQKNLDVRRPEKYRTNLLNINTTKDYVEIHPINTFTTSEDFLKPKYPSLKTIVLEGFGEHLPESVGEVKYLFEELPSGFVKDFDYGLGLIKDLQPLVSGIESIGAEHLVIKDAHLDKAELDTEHKILTLSYAQFEKIRKELNKVIRNSQSASRAVRKSVANNLLAYFLKDVNYPIRPLEIQNTPINKLVAKDVENVNVALSKSDQIVSISIVENNAKKISQDQPEKLLKLRDNIELVTLENLIIKYNEALEKKLNESYWQNLFNENPFILSMIFGCPIIKVQDQASVGGIKVKGTGNKITDFLLKNSKTNNTAIIEIKTPQTPILGKKYRDGVYSPSVELTGSLSQALDQKYNLQKNIASIKEASRIYNMETYSVNCALIIGIMPNDKDGEITVDMQKSFEIFRQNSKDVEIITFDELLEKLRNLCGLLSANN